MLNRLAFALLAVWPLALHAQSAPAGPWIAPDSATYARLARRVGGLERIRVWWRDTPIEVSGQAIGSAGVRAPRTDSTLAWSAIARVQVRGSAFFKGVKIGAIIGGLGGAAAGLASLRECRAWLDLFCGADAGDVVAMTFVGALTSGFLGGLIAAPFGTWQTVYRARPATDVRDAPLIVALHPDGRRMVALRIGLKLRV